MLSVVVPFFNEEENLPRLHKELKAVLKTLKISYEIIFVDDGSTDGSYKEVGKIKDTSLKVLKNRKQSGKGEALAKGIENSQGEILIFMDADLQDNPKDLPKFLNKINAGFDLVNGKRKNRKSNSLVKLYSTFANYLLRLLGSPYSDMNAPFKVFRRSVLKDISFYANNFRFFPLAVYYNGYKVTEVEVENRPRKFGKSKFGVGKVFIGFFDTLTAYFLYKFSERPLHFFGILGGILFLIGFGISLYLSIERLFFGVLLYRRPVLYLGILLIIVGIQIITTGIIGELIVYLNKKKANRG